MVFPLVVAQRYTQFVTTQLAFVRRIVRYWTAMDKTCGFTADFHHSGGRRFRLDFWAVGWFLLAGARERAALLRRGAKIDQFATRTVNREQRIATNR